MPSPPPTTSTPCDSLVVTRSSVGAVVRTEAAMVAWSALLATVVIGPMARRGWVVLLDWVTGPRLSLADRIVDGHSLPAGPLFFASAAVLQALFGAAMGWLLPALSLTIAGYGASRLVADIGQRSDRSSGTAVAVGAVAGAGPHDIGRRHRANVLAARATAATAMVWNPFVHERLYAGQLAVLAGYAALPFVAHAALHQGTTRRRVVATTVAWTAATACSVHYAIIGAVLLAACGVVRAAVDRDGIWRWAVATTALTAVLTGAWVLPIVHDAPAKGDARTIAAFATRPAALGSRVLGTLGGAGFWRASPGAPGPSHGWWYPVLGALLALAVAGSWAQRRGPWRATLVAVGLAAALGWLLGQGPGGLAGPAVRLLDSVPGFGVMREPAKFLALVPLAWAVTLAAWTQTAQAAIPRRTRPSGERADRSALGPIVAVVGIACAVLPLLLTPGLAWGVDGRLAAVRYPPGWVTIASRLDHDPGGRVLVLPFLGYLDPGFTSHRIVRAPAAAYFGSRALTSDDPQVPGLGPSARTRRIAASLAGDDASGVLADEGVRFVVAPEDAIPRSLLRHAFRRILTSRGYVLLEGRSYAR